jgi:putative SOS response-associated peptidase YedK
MCRRFTHHLTWRLVVNLYRLTDAPEPPAGFRASYNIAPSQSVLVIAYGDHGLEARMMRWGFIPARAPSKPSVTPINARGETVATSRVFKSAFRVRRCLVPASGFYEWQKQPGGGKLPYWLGMRDGRDFSIAGIWERWHGGEDGAAIDTFALITTEPNSLAAKIHNRMPVIVAQGDHDAWLIAEASAAQNLIRPYRAEAMKAYPISTRINSLKNNSPDIIKPAE